MYKILVLVILVWCSTSDMMKLEEEKSMALPDPTQLLNYIFSDKR